MSHVINSRALTGEKPCINKAIYELLMHGYATFNMIVPGHRFAAVTRCVLPGPRMSIVRGNCVRETLVKRRNKIVQEITRNEANIYSFLCNNSDRTWFCYALTFARSLGRCWKPRPSASVFNTSHETWRMLMHEKPCLIPILVLFGLVLITVPMSQFFLTSHFHNINVSFVLSSVKEQFSQMIKHHLAF